MGQSPKANGKKPLNIIFRLLVVTIAECDLSLGPLVNGTALARDLSSHARQYAVIRHGSLVGNLSAEPQMTKVVVCSV